MTLFKSGEPEHPGCDGGCAGAPRKYTVRLELAWPKAIPQVAMDKGLQLSVARSIAAFCGINENDVESIEVVYVETMKPGTFNGRLVETRPPLALKLGSNPS